MVLNHRPHSHVSCNSLPPQGRSAQSVQSVQSLSPGGLSPDQGSSSSEWLSSSAASGVSGSQGGSWQEHLASWLPVEEDAATYTTNSVRRTESGQSIHYISYHEMGAGASRATRRANPCGSADCRLAADVLGRGCKCCRPPAPRGLVPVCLRCIQAPPSGRRSEERHADLLCHRTGGQRGGRPASVCWSGASPQPNFAPSNSSCHAALRATLVPAGAGCCSARPACL